jgi:putative salt-induced outer membrane protein
MKLKINFFAYALLLLCSSLFAQEAAKAPEKKEWTHSTGAGLIITSGNTETTTANLSHNSAWERDKNKFTLSLSGAYGVKEVVDSSGDKYKDEFVSNFNEKAQYNRNFTDRFYWFVSEMAEVDKIINLEYRLTIGPGLGFNLLKKDPFKLDFELGVVYINQKFDNLDSEDNFSGRIAEKFNWKISANSNLWFNTEILYNFEDSKDYRINAELGIDVKINQNWLIRSTIQDKFYNNAPDPLEKYDIIFMTSIVFKY